MNKRNFWIGIAVIVVVVAAVLFGVMHKSNKTTPSSNSTTSSSSQTSTNSSSAPNQPTSSDIITTKSDPSTGQFLATSSGQPLYTYGADSNGVSNCSGACVSNWPIYGPASSPASLPANVTIITRSDGKAQYAYKGMPLYTFTGDSGSTPTGDNVENFHLAKP